METARKEPTRAARMSWPEVRATYPDCWVVLSDLDMDEVTLELRSAVVRGVSKGRRQAFERAQIQEGEAFAHYFTGLARHPQRW